MREIGLETNPSSNVMIGGFDSYDIHPIVSFYNRNLTNDVQKLEECPQLNVSVNTDDQAVFSTTLSNEFALLVSSLSKVKDEDGHYVYPKANIYAWVKDIMEMGNEQAFIKINMNREDLDEQENYRLDS